MLPGARRDVLTPPDTAVFGIKLRDGASVRTIVGGHTNMSALLRRHKMPRTMRNMRFTGGRLSRFQFGFEHPKRQAPASTLDAA